MKKLIQIVLGLGVIALAYVLWMQIWTPMQFEKESNLRRDAVVERLKDIRTAERAFKQKYSRYTDNFDTLINFVLNDSLAFYMQIGSYDDSTAVAQGNVRTEEYYVRAFDTIFAKNLKPVTVEMVKQFPYIPYSELSTEDGQPERFRLAAGDVWTDAGVLVPVFECKAPYRSFMGDMDRQELINMVDKVETWNDQPGVTNKQYAGIKVGSMETANNDAGNWE